ncbi:hypothetical protein [Dickeya fangzhongdai]|uniref:Uncharacterized protein n=1 Tax=Dickeya fangzhongdai TaxID=1778540 RepID=A0A2K8QGI2_9GAMM|nr:hypothetical protein [Dickeya fangzhongdai]ATZ92552.1 hypothetical protein CVE23_00295 [Dickeya fangzhongdai]QOH45981.1 hypothetical protein DYD82_00325 [Dickeya fangzhongdai]QOH50289.1 hypothetical protein DYD83_00335 [Dickeya fangzhongdai]UMB76924.1 hypothetical protein FXN80_00280 [Dickeya fangzhongdai]WOX98479.1 hypothetical protein OGM22_12405 [Dickeya fangzhongdai]
MKPIIWDLAGFNISMKGQYADIYELESDMEKNSGSSNFSEIDSLDWFLSNKITGQISFLLLTIPSVLKKSSEISNIDTNSLCIIKLSDCVHIFSDNVSIQNEATYFIKRNELVVTSNNSLIFYKVLISDDLYFLLDKNFTYQGYLLVNATHHIYGYIKECNDDIFNSFLVKMLVFCTQEAYDAMDDMDSHYLLMMNKLEEECSVYQHTDVRLLQIVDFIKHLKSTFYDIEID